jgi:hypothetical protein
MTIILTRELVMALHQEPQLRWGLRSGAKALGGQPLRV